MAISFVPVISGLCWGTARATVEVVRAGKTVVVESDSPKCLPNASTYIGIYMDDLSDTIKEEYQYPHEGGVLITGIANDSPAEKAGLEEHDIVYRFGTKEVENSVHLCSLVQAKKPGDKVALVIYRAGKKKTVEVTLGTRELPATIALEHQKLAEEFMNRAKEAGRMRFKVAGEPSMLKGRLGMVVEDLNKDLAPYFNVKEDEGVLVVEVEEESPAEKAGVKAGDVITAIGDAPVHNVEALSNEVSKANEGDTLAVDLIRKGAKKSVAIEVGKGGPEVYFYSAPFEWNVKRLDRPERPGRQSPPDFRPAEREQLKEDIDSLKEQLKDLEERLDKMEKKR